MTAHEVVVLLSSDEDENSAVEDKVTENSPQENRRTSTEEDENEPMDIASGPSSDLVAHCPPQYQQIIDSVIGRPELAALLVDGFKTDAAGTRNLLVDIISNLEPIKKRQAEMEKEQQENLARLERCEQMEKEVTQMEAEVQKYTQLIAKLKLGQKWQQIVSQPNQSGPVQTARKQMMPALPLKVKQTYREDDEVVTVGVFLQPEKPKPGEVEYFQLKAGMDVVCQAVYGFGSYYSTATVAEVGVLVKVILHDTSRTHRAMPDGIIPKVPQTVLLPIAQRVVAHLHTADSLNNLFAGFVAEQPSTRNRIRYLIFFDSGAAGYCSPSELYAMKQNELSAIETHKGIKGKELYGQFLERYFRDYPEVMLLRPRMQEQLLILVDENWKKMTLQEEDASMMRIKIKSPARFEWVFRGSHRLKIIYRQMFPPKPSPEVGLEQPIAQNHRPLRDLRSTRSTRERQILQYQLQSEDEEDCERSERAAQSSKRQCTDQVASTSIQPVAMIFNPNAGAMTSTRTGRILGVRFKNHDCGPCCLLDSKGEPEGYSEAAFRNQNFFSIPLLTGWWRDLRFCGKKKSVYYLSPCGRSLSNIDAVKLFLNISCSELTVDMFTFDVKVQIVSKKMTSNTVCYYFDADFAKGKETQPISVLNALDASPPDLPDDFEYVSKRILSADLFNNVATAKGNLEDSFKSCCDCEDNCSNPETCACQQLTKNSTNSVPWGNYKTDFFHRTGYVNRRLFPILTGLYECNESCSCTRTCPNKLVSTGIRMKLQLYNYPNKGWGIRALHDIPFGTFLCLYSAEILTPEEGNDKRRDDTYFAEMNNIEWQEKFKDNYAKAPEFDVDDSSEDEYRPEQDLQGYEDEEDHGAESSDSQDCAVEPLEQMLDDEDGNGTVGTTRQALFNEQQSYVLDSKFKGNIGRFFNHSCQPNCIVQSVFLDTHDMRFPHIALFTNRFVSALEELTWDYGYEVGSVAGRRLKCYCGAKRCRGRLL